jgi:hypothetical protein
MREYNGALPAPVGAVRRTSPILGAQGYGATAEAMHSRR